MEVTIDRNLIIAALIAFAFHGLLALTDAPSAHFSSQSRVGKNKAIEISMVSAYRETDKKLPVEGAEKPVENEKGEGREKRAAIEKISEEPAITREDSVKDRDRDVFCRSEKSEENIILPSLEAETKPISEVKEVVSALPRYREHPQPRYPPIARRRGYEGTTLLSLWVLEDGTVGEVVVKKTSGHSILDRAAVRAAEKWLFEPASTMGKAIPLWVDVPIRFVIRGKK
ncbi:MAG: energy transducer TonB [Deltaproteobacteria bacterium]|nr:energy transducer TonB [Deltaproteobacteria bacterium]MBN2844667.1 energy transducer TonB [Deltaproteobacteria bacterium]